VDSLFPSYVLDYLKCIHTRTLKPSQTLGQHVKSKRLGKQRCCLGGRKPPLWQPLTWTPPPSSPDDNSLGVKVETLYTADLGICWGAGGRVFYTGRTAFPQPLLLPSSSVPAFLGTWPPYIPPNHTLLARKTSSLSCGPGSITARAPALVLLPTPVLVLCSGRAPCSCPSL